MAEPQDRRRVALNRGDVQTAVSHLRAFDKAIDRMKSDRFQWELQSKPLLEWARVAVARRECKVAATLLGAIDSFLANPRLGSHLPVYLAEIDLTRSKANSNLDDLRFVVAWNDGIEMTSSEAYDFALNLLDDAEHPLR